MSPFSYSRCLELMLTHVTRHGPLCHLMVASHNEESVRQATRRMWELGMCDHVSLALGQAGYAVYKSIPYGSLEEASGHPVSSPGRRVANRGPSHCRCLCPARQPPPGVGITSHRPGQVWQLCSLGAPSLQGKQNKNNNNNNRQLYLFSLYLKGKERERDLPSADSLTPNAHNSQGWARLKSGGRNCIWVSHVGGRGPRQKAGQGQRASQTSLSDPKRRMEPLQSWALRGTVLAAQQGQPRPRPRGLSPAGGADPCPEAAPDPDRVAVTRRASQEIHQSDQRRLTIQGHVCKQRSVTQIAQRGDKAGGAGPDSGLQVSPGGTGESARFQAGVGQAQPAFKVSLGCGAAGQASACHP
uniref:Proline dehydrogenase n=1 Tax=Oryctolagus cuniculus TaxID=9986 RepID=A0A5F9C3I3_RABIT